MKKIHWESWHYDVSIDGSLHQEKPQQEYYDEESDLLMEEEIHKGLVMATPFGFWRVDDSMNPMKQFQMWMGHTNFTIDKRVQDVIKRIEGVEVLRIISRYRFIIAVGRLFDFREVRVAIHRALCGTTTDTILEAIENNQLRQEVIETIERLKITDKDWALLLLPNGKIDIAWGANMKEKIVLFKTAKEKLGAILIESSEYSSNE
jgi:hypothetical protein